MIDNRKGRMLALALTAACAAQAAADVSLSIGTGFVFGGHHGGWGWGGPVISIGTIWHGDSYGRRHYDGWHGWGHGWSARRCDVLSYASPLYHADGRNDEGGVEVDVSARIAQAPRPAAPAVPAESNMDKGWRLLESGEPGAMEAFGRAVARSEGDGSAHLGYAICAANAGQFDRADWAARAALKRDPDVIARAPGGAGVRAASDSAIAALRRARGSSGAMALGLLGGLATDDAQPSGAVASTTEPALTAQEPMPSETAAPAESQGVEESAPAPEAPLLTPPAASRRVTVPVKPGPR